jgi:superoxide dismutase, Cu-Zn family
MINSKKMVRFLLSSLACVAALGQAALAQTEAPTAPPIAQAKLEGKSGAKVGGVVDFVESAEGAGIKISYKIDGLKKNQIYGFHIHEKGDCSSNDAKSAGPHYLEVAPAGGTSTDSPQKHAGDLPPIKSDSKGVAQGSFTVESLSVNKSNAVAQRAIIVHGGPDNPNKKSAPRIACGVIEMKLQ